MVSNMDQICQKSFPIVPEEEREKAVSSPLSYLEALTRGGVPPARRHTEGDIQSPPSSHHGQEQLLDVHSSSPPGILRSRICSRSGGRGRSFSFSIPSSNVAPQASSPLQWREHASESGSPTLEQVLLMSRQSPGSVHSPTTASTDFPSLSVGNGSEFTRYPGHTHTIHPIQPSSNPPSASSTPSPTSISSSMARLTMADVVGIDAAVAQAAQTLQTLQQQQAALYCGGMGGLMVPPQFYTPREEQHHNHQVNHMLGSILANVQQQQQQQTGGKQEVGLHHRDPFTGRQEIGYHRDGLAGGRQEGGGGLHHRDHLGGGRQELGFHNRDPLALERAARLYRSAASVCEASCTWSGQLPPRSSTAGPHSSYSTKIFLGGVPWDISEQTLVQAFAEFGDVRVEWPGRDYTSPPRGYLYLVFQDERDLIDLLSKCGQDYSSRDSYYYKISSRRMRSKEVQIIPWVISDSNFVKCASPRLDPQKTVFVGALHGMMTAQGLALIFQDLFGGVVYAGLDTDKFKYPIGSGRVTFNNNRAYMKAVAAAFIEIKTPRFCKKVQVDPYLEDTLCSLCGMKQGPYFCRDLSCFNYFCHGCWDLQHTGRPPHKPLMRNIRGLTRARTAHHSLPPDLGGAGRYRAQALDDLAQQFGQTFGPQTFN